MKLGDVYDALTCLEDNDFVFSEAFDDVMSYRGYYNEVAFAPKDNVPLFVVKEQLDRAFNEEFTGYKGGEYTYNSDTPAHLASYGLCDDSDSMALEALVGKMLVEYSKKVQFDNRYADVLEQCVEKPKKEKKVTKRKTKAELAKEQENLDKAAWEVFVKQYPQRLTRMVFEYGNRTSETFQVGFNESTNEYHFIVDNDYFDVWCDRWLPAVIKADQFDKRVNLLWQLELVEGAVESMNLKLKQQEEKTQKRQTALNKLTQEEKELLGL